MLQAKARAKTVKAAKAAKTAKTAPIAIEAYQPPVLDNPWLLDLFCGAGGAGEGYRRAGMHIVGVDQDSKVLKHNPHEAYCDDALDVLTTLLAGGKWHGYRLHDFQAIHASPPRQAYSRTRTAARQIARDKTEPPMLIDAVRQLLQATGLPYLIENVEGARRAMFAPVMLCGSTLGLRVIRHRLFESNMLLFSAGTCRHSKGATLCGDYITVAGHGYNLKQPKHTQADREVAMGIDWMTRDELAQAIPPAYTHWLGAQLLDHLSYRRLSSGQRQVAIYA